MHLEYYVEALGDTATNLTYHVLWEQENSLFQMQNKMFSAELADFMTSKTRNTYLCKHKVCPLDHEVQY